MSSARVKGADGLAMLFARLLRPSCTDRGFDMLALFGWRQHGLHAQRMKPQLPAPTLGVIKMFVFFVLDLGRRAFQYMLIVAGSVFGTL